jgi:hypothetical protein
MIEWYERTEDGVTTRVPAQEAVAESRAAWLDRVTDRALVRKISRERVRKSPGETDTHYRVDINDRHVVLTPLRASGQPC